MARLGHRRQLFPLFHPDDLRDDESLNPLVSTRRLGDMRIVTAYARTAIVVSEQVRIIWSD